MANLHSPPHLYRDLASVGVGIIVSLGVMIWPPDKYSYALRFLVCASALLLVQSGILSLLRSHLPSVLNAPLQQAQHDLRSWYMSFPVLIAGWIVARNEPLMGTSILFAKVAEVGAVIVMCGLLVRAFVQWPEHETLLQTVIDKLHKASAFICVLLLALGIAAQLRTADMPQSTSPSPARTPLIVSGSDATSMPSKAATAHHAEICDPDDEDADDCDADLGGVTSPTVIQNTRSTEAAAGVEWTASTSFLRGMVFSLLDRVAQNLADSPSSFHASSVAIVIGSLLKILGRLYLLFSKARAMPINHESESEVLVETIEDLLDPNPVEATSKVALANLKNVNQPSSQPTLAENLETAPEQATHPVENILRAVAETALQEVLNPLVQSPAMGSSAPPLGGERQASSITNQAGDQATSTPMDLITQQVSHALSYENQQTLIRLQNLLAQTQVNTQSNGLERHRPLVEKLLNMAQSAQASATSAARPS